MKNGLGIKNWHTKLPVAQRLIVGPRSSRPFQRACMVAMLAVVEQLRRAAPSEGMVVRVVALIDPHDLFRSSIDVFWGDAGFFDFFDRSGEAQAWTPIADASRSLVREWRLETDLGEVGFTTTERWYEDEPPYRSELWVVGDVDRLGS